MEHDAGCAGQATLALRGADAPFAYDVLTGLASQSTFADQVDRALQRAWRAPAAVAVLVLRAADLPLVSDRFGRPVADELLAAAASRLQGCLREIDTIARLDGDALGVLLEADASDARAEVRAADVANRLVVAFAEPLATSVADLATSARIGVAVGDGSVLHADELVQRATLALAEVPAGPGGGFRFYAPEQQEAALRRLQLKAALGRALDRDALSLRYQPLVSLQTGALVGVEALLRWHDAERGAVPPSEFIPLAEESDLIVPIGEWVLRTALDQRARWVESIPGVPFVGMSINVSARQLARPGLLGAVERCLADVGLPADVLLLELTESTLMADDEVVRAQLRGLRELGVRIALDDFGTGWSSLEYLCRVPVDVLKIARCFVDRIGTSTRATALVRAIIELAHSLGLITVAEGVERAEQADALRQMGCFLGQGWHFARELTVDDATVELRRLAAAAGGGSS